MSRNYEMMYILRPDLLEDQVEAAINKYRDFLSEQGAENIQIQNRGKRRLAYPIKKHLDGIYVQMNYQADGKQVAPLERAMRLGEEVIRYLTIKLKDEPIMVSSETKVETEVETEAITTEVEA
ncbi:MAG: 30S ribosomal protein S6 [Stanieria sp.]